MKKLTAKQRSEQPHIALPLNTIERVRPGEAETIVGKSIKHMVVDEMAVSKVATPFFDIEEVRVAGKAVPLTLMQPHVPGETPIYEIPPTPLMKGEEVTVTVRNKSPDEHMFQSVMMGVQV